MKLGFETGVVTWTLSGGTDGLGRDRCVRNVKARLV
jgi:hypothetical protein